MTQEIKIESIEAIENVRVIKNKAAIIDLMNSIKQHGLLQPIGVSKTKSGKYVVCYGHRRLEACKKLGWKTIEAMVEEEKDLKEHLITNVVENAIREGNTPFELGRVCHRLMSNFGMTKQEIASRLNITANAVKTALVAFGDVPVEFRDKVVYVTKGKPNKNGNISASAMSLVMTLARQHHFSKKEIVHILEETRANELSGEDIKVLGHLIKEGVTPKKALEELKNYRVFSLDVVVNIPEINALTKREKKNATQTLRSIVYGEVKGLTRPSFVKG